MDITLYMVDKRVIIYPLKIYIINIYTKKGLDIPLPQWTIKYYGISHFNL
jgi:hypothetical protein